jgi:hypothetical protein
MKALREVRFLIFGETWVVPLGVFATVATAAAIQHVAGHWWHPVGGLVLLAGTLGTLTFSSIPSFRRGS